MSETTINVLFVCMGNICRSPTAEGVFRKVVEDAGLADRITIDSAGTHAFHVNEPPDRRAIAAAERRGFLLQGIRARRVAENDFEEFDYILAMDADNLRELQDRAEEVETGNISLFLEFARTSAVSEVPDPYYGGPKGFERVLDLIEDASEGLLADLRELLERDTATRS